MIRKVLGVDTDHPPSMPKEGDLFKNIALCGKTFEIRYGFYEERDRHTQFAEPIPIYPDLLRQPQFAADGTPFVTQMQAPCEHFVGEPDEDSGCGDCAFYRHGEELLGTCDCPRNKQTSKEVGQQ